MRGDRPEVMTELIRLYTQIALLRRGPQDVPASALLLTVTVFGYFLVNCAVSAVLPPLDDPWVAHLLLDVAFTLLWYFLLLKLLGRSERILQTTTAVFGFQTIIAPVLVLCGWLIRRFLHDPLWSIPVQLMGLALFIWYVAANGHVVKAALEWSTVASILIVIAQEVAGEALVLAVFPAPR